VIESSQSESSNTNNIIKVIAYDDAPSSSTKDLGDDGKKKTSKIASKTDIEAVDTTTITTTTIKLSGGDKLHKVVVSDEELRKNVNRRRKLKDISMSMVIPASGKAGKKGKKGKSAKKKGTAPYP